MSTAARVEGDALCPCGSGKPYAACHGAQTTNPQAAQSSFELGNVLRNRGDYPGAIDAYREGLGHEPNNARLLNNLGLALFKLGRYQEAHDAFRRACDAEPRNAQTLNNLGLALVKLARYDQAEEAFSAAWRADSAFFEARANLAEALFEQKRFTDALPLLAAAVQCAPRNARLWAKLGECQQRASDLSAALESYQRVIDLAPNDAKQRFNVGWLLQCLGRHAEAVERYREALAIDPGFAEVRMNLYMSERAICNWSHLDELAAILKTGVDGPEAPPFPPILYLSSPFTPAEQLIGARNWNRSRGLDGAAAMAPALARSGGERLRVGYMSSDFRQHPVGILISELLESHDRSRCEVFAYAHGPRDVSQERERIMRAVDHWRDISADADEAAAQRIRNDRIHVLLDLNGHSSFSRMEILALRPAPIQVAYLGYPGTCGGNAHDYLLTDRFVCPPEQQVHFTERFLYLPHCLMPSDTQRPLRSALPTRAACGLPEHGFVFCGFNNLFKLLPPMFDVWMRLLRTLPDSVLWLRAGPSIEHNLRREAQRRGVQADRLVFAPRVADSVDHLTRHRLADLFLDTLPYNAHSTANDALYAGLPVLTCAGETFASRVAGSQLLAIGLPELVTHSLADYEAMALRLARDPDLLKSLRARLAANRRTHPLFDMARFARDFENTLEGAWNTYAAGRANSD
jgi:predicted O-linked N-acetylglucosamine transferase (SPINDLY family)